MEHPHGTTVKEPSGLAIIPGGLNLTPVEIYAAILEFISEMTGEYKDFLRSKFYNTKLFEIPTPVVINLLQHASDDVFDLLCIDPEKPLREKNAEATRIMFDNPDKTQLQIVSELLSEYYCDASLPNHLPFNNFLMCFNGGMLTQDATDKFIPYTIVGILVTPTNVIGVEVSNEKSTAGLLTFENMYDGKWHTTCAALVKIVLDAINIINSYRTYVTEQPRNLSYKLLYNKAIKRLHIKKSPPPPPFYTITLSDKIINDRYISKSHARIAAAYRWDVRGHERVRYQRGDLPIPKDIKDTLTLRGYKIYEDSQPDEFTHELLDRRNIITRQPQEWLAVKISWVTPHINGPREAPYVPAIRKVPA
jgi:hypothetical protein